MIRQTNRIVKAEQYNYRLYTIYYINNSAEYKALYKYLKQLVYSQLVVTKGIIKANVKTTANLRLIINNILFYKRIILYSRRGGLNHIPSRSLRSLEQKTSYTQSTTQPKVRIAVQKSRLTPRALLIQRYIEEVGIQPLRYRLPSIL